VWRRGGFVRRWEVVVRAVMRSLWWEEVVAVGWAEEQLSGKVRVCPFSRELACGACYCNRICFSCHRMVGIIERKEPRCGRVP
jgi:hypothetical protein